MKRISKAEAELAWDGMREGVRANPTNTLDPPLIRRVNWPENHHRSTIRTSSNSIDRRTESK